MATLLVFAFIAGMLTTLSPCALPVLPFVLGSVDGGNRPRTIGVIAGFAASFVASAVLLAAVLVALGLSTQPLRLGSAVLLGLFGLTLAVPALSLWFEGHAGAIALIGTRVTSRVGGGLSGGFVLGAAIGLVWAPCLGPIMGAVIAAAVVAGPSGGALAVSLAYVSGAGLGMAAVAVVGRRVIGAVGRPETVATAQRLLGLTMVVAAFAVVTGLDFVAGQALTRVLPADIARAIVAVEERPDVEEELSVIRPTEPSVGTSGGVAGAVNSNVALPQPLSSTLPASVALEDLGSAPEVRGITDWINSEPLSLGSLRGKVVLVHFWTFGCINCIHVQPYVKAWYDRYHEAGLVVVGVHTPELSFERDIGNVRKAVAEADVRFPVAFDPAYATWQAYGNHYWPAFYFVDRHGAIRHVHFGEGDYDGSEQVIRQLLLEAH